MGKSNYKSDSLLYDTTINVVGGLRDCDIIYKAIYSHFSMTSSLEEFANGGRLGLRTERSQTRVLRAIKKAFLQFVNQDHQDLIHAIFKEDVPIKDKNLVLLWQFALNNRLFREITDQVFVKIYYSGRVVISKEDITAYLKESIIQNNLLEINWTQSTINTLSTKYLNFLSKLNFLSPGRNKSIIHVTPSSESQVLFLYFAKLYSSEKNDILTNKLLPLSFIPLEDIHAKYKKLSMKGFFNMNYNGIALNIDLIHSYKGVCDALYNRS